MSRRWSERRFTLAVLGSGAAARAHARVLSRDHPSVRLLQASRDPARAAGLGIREPFSYQAALASAHTDAVVVATPPDTHLLWVTEALRAGKDVIVEKPAFLGTAELDFARRCAERAGRRLLVAENYPHKPLAARLRAILADGLIGDPLFLLLNAAKRQPVAAWRKEVGALCEGGIHWVSLMSSLGPVVTTGKVFRAGKATGPDRSTLCAVTFENGMVGTLAYSWEAHSSLRGLRLSTLQGSAGTVAFESNGAFVALRGRRRRLWPLDPRDPAGERAMWRDLLAAIRLDRPPRYGIADAARDLKLVADPFFESGALRRATSGPGGFTSSQSESGG